VSHSRAHAPRRRIAVTLLLAGGHEQRLSLKATDPVLTALLGSVASRENSRTRSTIFNLETEDGKGSVVLAASDVIAISTTPAISIDLARHRVNFEARHMKVENYLPTEAVAALLKFVEDRKHDFRPSRATGHTPSEGKSLRVLNELGAFGHMFRERVRIELPRILARLRIPPFPLSEIDCQLLAYGDGHHLGRHRDKGPPPGTSRIVSFGYYFHREPRRFDGGELRLYDGIVENGQYTSSETATDLSPPSNTMVFFPSASYHEVLPIRCPSRRFGDGRFVINGWVHRAS